MNFTPASSHGEQSRCRSSASHRGMHTQQPARCPQPRSQPLQPTLTNAASTPSSTQRPAGAPCVPAGGRQVEQVLGLVQERANMFHYLRRQRPPVSHRRRVGCHGRVAQRVLEAARVGGWVRGGVGNGEGWVNNPGEGAKQACTGDADWQPSIPSASDPSKRNSNMSRRHCKVSPWVHDHRPAVAAAGRGPRRSRL